MKLRFLGGAQEMTAQCVLVCLKNKNIMFDCGIHQEDNKERPHAIFLSHAHLAQSSYLPILSGRYPEIPIFCTPLTKALLKVVLRNSISKDVAFNEEVIVYNQSHEELFARIVCFNPNYTFKPFKDDELRITFYSAGHIPGAIGIHVSSEEGTLFYTGDYCFQSQCMIEGASFKVEQIDTVICGGSYQDQLQINRRVEENRLLDAIDKCCMKGGKVVVLGEALGKMQEVLFMLKKAVAKQVIAPLRLYIDHTIKDICTIYEMYPHYLRKRLGNTLHKGESIFFDDLILTSEELKHYVESTCMLVSRERLDDDLYQSMHSIISKEENLVILIEDEKEIVPQQELRMWLEKQKTKCARGCQVVLNDEEEIKAEVMQLRLSYYGGYAELTTLLNYFKPRHTYLMHGEKSTMDYIGKHIQFEGQVYIPQQGDLVDIPDEMNLPIVKLSRLPRIGCSDMLTKEGLKKLWTFIIKYIGPHRGLTLEEIYIIWYGYAHTIEYELLRLNALLLNTPYFSRETKRPFIYHAVDSEALIVRDENVPMDVDTMLRCMRDYFMPEMGLYKKSIHKEEKIVRLYFYFPQKVKELYSDHLKAFAVKTKWLVEVNESIHFNYAQTLLHIYLQEIGKKGSNISYYRDENVLKIATEEIAVGAALSERFFLETGIHLKLEEEKDGAKVPQTKPQSIVKDSYAMEQNKALYKVEQLFEDRPHKLYKRGIKILGNTCVIELSFITPYVGKYYKKEIAYLEATTGWCITINPRINHNELQVLASRLCREVGLKPTKISYRSKTKSIHVKGIKALENETSLLKRRFFKETGIAIYLE